MKKFLIKNKKNLGLVLIAAIAFNFVFLPIPVSAAWYSPADWFGSAIGWIGGRVVLFISSLISMILGAVFGVIIGLEAKIIDLILSPTNFPLTTAPIVTLGWGITRDLANMFFILILLIIAFATVLKIQSYAIKQLWLKVLVAALLINFSLVIAGFVIDFTQVLTGFFLNQITGGGIGTITTKLAASMQILNFYQPAAPTSLLEGAADLGASSVAAFVGLILTLVGLVITVFVFGAAMIFLIVRIIHLWLLLIFAPIVWMLWILPATSKYFSQWWDDFIKWAFFAPIFVFMIYLSLSIFDATGELNPKVFGVISVPGWTTPAPGLTKVGMPAAIFQWILVIAMMFGSLIVAQKFGVEGATGARKILTGWGESSKNWAGRQLRRQALRVGAREAAPGVEARPGLLVRGAQKLAATRIIGRELLAGQVFKMTAAEAGTVEDAQKQFANWTPEAIQEYLKKSPGRITSPFVQNQQMGAALALKEKGKLDKVDEARIKELAALASRYSPKNVDKLLEVAPHLAIEFNKKIKDIVAKIEKADQIMLSSLGSSEVVLNLNPNQLKDIAQKADDVKIQRLKGVVDAELNSIRTNPDPAVSALAGEIDKIVDEPRKDQRNKMLMALNAKDPQAAKVARSKFITSSPAWDI